MILGTSKISLLLGPINGHFWARGPRIYGFSHAKIPQKILESLWETSWKNIIFTFWNFKNISNLDPLNTYLFLIFVLGIPPKKDWYILSFLKDIDHNTFWKILRDHLF